MPCNKTCLLNGHKPVYSNEVLHHQVLSRSTGNQRADTYRFPHGRANTMINRTLTHTQAPRNCSMLDKHITGSGAVDIDCLWNWISSCTGSNRESLHRRWADWSQKNGSHHHRCRRRRRRCLGCRGTWIFHHVGVVITIIVIGNGPVESVGARLAASHKPPHDCSFVCQGIYECAKGGWLGTGASASGKISTHSFVMI